MPTISNGYRDGTSYKAQRHARMRAADLAFMQNRKRLAALKAESTMIPETPLPILADRLDDLDRHDDAAWVREQHAIG